MKTLIKSIKLTLVCCVLLSVGYVLVLWLFARVVGPGKGNAETTVFRGKVVGATAVGQAFSKDIYFWGRPSCAGKGYNATSSCGSNKGPSNREYLREVNHRIDLFIIHHPYLKRKDVPAEMVTASASGLDPDISPESAYVQVRRVAQARHLVEKIVKRIVDENIQRPLWNLFGPEKVNVLQLNIALDELIKNGNGDK